MAKIKPSKSIVDFQIKPGAKVRLADYDPGWAGDTKVDKNARKRFAEELLGAKVNALTQAQEVLWASDSWAVLVVLQALDAAGKDGVIKHVMSGVNPQGCRVTSFKQPSALELDHNFLWRYNPWLPQRGQIGIFNRSYYEEVLVVRVHQHFINAQRIPNADPARPGFWKDRYDDINAFERHLTRNGMLILKFFLNVSREEQKKRFLKRLNQPDKHWKFSTSDVHERGYWNDYQHAYEEALSATSTPWAPWHVVPADHKWVTRAVVALVIAQGIQGLKLEYPRLTPEKQAAMDEARRLLDQE